MPSHLLSQVELLTLYWVYPFSTVSEILWPPGVEGDFTARLEFSPATAPKKAAVHLSWHHVWPP